MADRLILLQCHKNQLLELLEQVNEIGKVVFIQLAFILLGKLLVQLTSSVLLSGAGFKPKHCKDDIDLGEYWLDELELLLKLGGVGLLEKRFVVVHDQVCKVATGELDYLEGVVQQNLIKPDIFLLELDEGL